MAKKSSDTNGHGSLEDATRQLEIAVATAIQTQATTLAQLAEYQRRHLEFEEKASQRFARIETQMAEVIRVLNEHTRTLDRLPEAVRDKIGFKGQQ
ncbi:MAG TPA: hypothetical protein VFE62_18185 [Gemmataceae bacterium]|nr:hypothetical protein [Gemmataceae bacterium]